MFIKFGATCACPVYKLIIMLILNIVDVLLQSARKSALLSAAKKAKLKSNPSRVRFAEGVVVNGSPLFAVSSGTVSI
jgi:hypothetical protein